MQPSFRRQQPYRLCRHIRSIGDQHIDPASQRRWQRAVEVTLVDLATGQVPPGASRRHRVDIRAVQLHARQAVSKGGANRTGTAAQVKDNRARPGETSNGNGLTGKEFGTAAGYEYPGVDVDPQTTELCPAQDVLEWHAGRSTIDHRGEVFERLCRLHEQLRFVLCVDTADGSKPGNDG